VALYLSISVAVVCIYCIVSLVQTTRPWCP